MREKLDSQIKQLKDAIERLVETLKMEPTRVNKDATIQRFEFTFELAWKVMKSVAFIQGMEAVSPRESIRTAAQIGLIDNIDLWFDFLDARNRSSHLYNEVMADEVYELTKKFLTEAKKMIEKLEEQIIDKELSKR